MSKKEMRIIGQGRRTRLILVNNWEYVDRINVCGIVTIVAVTKDDKILLTQQYRLPLDKDVIELPAGLAGDIKGQEKEPLEEAAKRELLEETGYEAGEMLFLTEGPPSAGLTSEIITFFLARDLKKTGAGGGVDGENITLHEIPLGQVHDWLIKAAENGLLIDPKLYAGLYFAFRDRAGMFSMRT